MKIGARFEILILRVGEGLNFRAPIVQILPKFDSFFFFYSGTKFDSDIMHVA